MVTVLKFNATAAPLRWGRYLINLLKNKTMKNFLIEWTVNIGKEPETFRIVRKSEKTAKTFFNKLKADPNVVKLQAYILTPTEF